MRLDDIFLEWRKNPKIVAKWSKKWLMRTLVPALAISLLMRLFSGPYRSIDFFEWFWFFTGVLTVVWIVIGFFIVLILGESIAGIAKENIGGALIEPVEEPQNPDGVPIGNVRMPAKNEPLHTLVEGAPGTGKTQLFKQWIRYLRDRGDTVVIVDSGFDQFNTFGRKGDILLSTFDERSPGWSLENEVNTANDWDALAETLIEEGEGNAREWNLMARAFFSAVCRSYWQSTKETGEPFDRAYLFHLLTAAKPEAVKPFLEGSASAALDDDDGKGLRNVRLAFGHALKFWPELKDGNFSVRDWVAQKGQRPSIFIPHTKRTLPASRTLIATWLEQMINEACDQGENRDNRVWIFVDELASLGKIPALETAVTELRKTGFCVVVGIQNLEQIEQRYTKTGAATIGNSLGNKVIFRANSEAAAERQSRLIGETRYRMHKTSVSSGRSSSHDGNTSSSRSSSSSIDEKVERAILPAEIMALPDLVSLVKFAGNEVTYSTEIPIYDGEKTGGGQESETPFLDSKKLTGNEPEELARKIAEIGPRSYSQAEFEEAFGEGIGPKYMASQQAMTAALAAHGLRDAGNESYDRPITIAAAAD